MRVPSLGMIVLTLALATAGAAFGSTFGGPFGLEKAGWTLVTASDETYVYMRAAPNRGDDVRRVWTAYDSALPRERQGFRFHSVESLGEFDCRRRVSRIVEERFHGQPGLTGPKWRAPDFKPTPWVAPTPESVGAVRMAFACRALTDT